MKPQRFIVTKTEIKTVKYEAFGRDANEALMKVLNNHSKAFEVKHDTKTKVVLPKER